MWWPMALVVFLNLSGLPHGIRKTSPQPIGGLLPPAGRTKQDDPILPKAQTANLARLAKLNNSKRWQDSVNLPPNPKPEGSEQGESTILPNMKQYQLGQPASASDSTDDATSEEENEKDEVFPKRKCFKYLAEFDDWKKVMDSTQDTTEETKRIMKEMEDVQKSTRLTVLRADAALRNHDPLYGTNKPPGKMWRKVSCIALGGKSKFLPSSEITEVLNPARDSVNNASSLIFASLKTRKTLGEAIRNTQEASDTLGEVVKIVLRRKREGELSALRPNTAPAKFSPTTQSKKILNSPLGRPTTAVRILPGLLYSGSTPALPIAKQNVQTQGKGA